jgi:hypothetical protein
MKKDVERVVIENLWCFPAFSSSDRQSTKKRKRFRIFRVCENLILALPEYKSKTPSERACCACVGLYELAVYNIRPLILAEYIFGGRRAHCLLL